MNRPLSPDTLPSCHRDEGSRDEPSLEMGVYTPQDDSDPIRGLFNGLILSIILWCLMIAGGCFAFEVISQVWRLFT